MKKRCRQIFIICSLFSILWSGTSSRAANSDYEALKKGRVITISKKVPGFTYDQVVSKGVIDAPMNVVLASLTDYEHYEEFIPNMTESKVLKVEGDDTFYFSKVNMPWPISDISYQCRATLYKDGTGYSFELVPGTGVGVKDFRGTWEVQPFDGSTTKTLATYTLSYVPEKNYAPWIVKMGSKHTVEKNIDAFRKRIKHLESNSKK